MQLFCGKQRGSICVFLTLILVPVLLFSGIIVDASRLFASKTVVSGAGDLTMNAALAQYDKNLKDGYGLTAMAKAPDSPDEKQKLRQIFCESIYAGNLENKDDEELSAVIQLSLMENGFEAKGVETSSLADTDVLRQQIVEYMKFRGPVYIADDIVQKLKKLPFDHLDQQKKYVETKTDYGIKASKLDKPLKEAKEAIESQAGAIDLLKNTDPFAAVNTYKEQSVFRLAAKSMEKYISGELPPSFPADTPDTITQDIIMRYLEYNVEFYEGDMTFDQEKYRHMITLLALKQLIHAQPQAEAGISEKNGYSEHQVKSYKDIEKTVRRNINTMDHNYKTASKEYKDNIKRIKGAADSIITNGNTAINKLKDVKKKWKNVEDAKKRYDQAKTDLKSTGEDISGLETEQEDIDINIKALEELIERIQMNINGAEIYKKSLKQLEDLPQQLESQQISYSEGILLENMTASQAADQFWSGHNLLDGIQDVSSAGFSSPLNTEFYQNTLAGVTEEPVKNENQEQNRNDAAQKETDFNDQKNNILNAAEGERNLKEIEGFPDIFPSGIAGTSINSGLGTGDRKTDTSSDENTVEAVSSDMAWLGSLAACLDSMSGKILEQTYLMEYMSEMFNCMTTKAGDQSLSGMLLSEHKIINGEIEYILYGNANTAVNKAAAYMQLYAARLAIDLIYAFTDSTVTKEADAVAKAVVAASQQAWLYPIIKYGYLTCRAIAMAAGETGSLVSGKECLVWPGDKGKKSAISFSYKDYMKLFLLIALTGENGKADLVARTGDCIQLNTGDILKNKYTMLTLKADVETSTIFLPKVPAFMGQSGNKDNGKRRIRYRSVLAY